MNLCIRRKIMALTKKIALIATIIFVFGIIMADGVIAGMKTMNFKLVSMLEKVEVVKVTDMEGVVIGVIDRKGLSMFENGDIATTACRGTFDTKKGFQGYSSLTFADGSTLVLSWTGPTSRVAPGGKFGGFTAKFEYANGTGRFKGIKGKGTFSEKKPNWDKAFKTKGFTYYEWTETYDLSSQ
jgi:hypothetical protein